jgi:hypothetical protein
VNKGGEDFERVLQELAGDDADVAVDCLCEASVRAVGVDAASVAVMSGTDVRETICASTSMAAETDRIQFSTGEGPCVSAFETGEPQFIRDTHGPDAYQWPAFSDMLARNLPDVRAMYGFALAIGGERIGSINLIDRSPGALSEQQVRWATDAAGVGALAVLRALARRLGPHELDFFADHTVQDRTDLYLAVGLISRRGGLRGTDALALLRGHAYANGRLADDVARDVLTGRVELP